MPMTEIAPDLWLSMNKREFQLQYGPREEDALYFTYADVSGISRALSVVKESKQYAAWLKKEGLA